MHSNIHSHFQKKQKGGNKMLRFFLLAILLGLARSNPLPQSLTEDQFRGFDDDDDEPEMNKVKIVSGYSNVRQIN